MYNSRSRWTREEELELIKNISNKVSFTDIATKHNRSVSAIELRLKKIIYENVTSGKQFETISKLLNIDIDKIKQYYYSYKEFSEKHDQQLEQPVITNNQQINTNNLENINKFNMDNIFSPKYVQSGGNKLNKIERKLKKLELENKILHLIVENKEMTHKLNKLIKDGKVDKSVKKLIKTVRNQ